MLSDKRSYDNTGAMHRMLKGKIKTSPVDLWRGIQRETVGNGYKHFRSHYTTSGAVFQGGNPKVTANNIPRMETVKTTAKMFGLAEHFVRQLVLSGKIVAVKTGRKYLVNVDKFAEYLNSAKVADITAVDTENNNGITPIPVKL